MSDEQKESSVLFSLKELMSLEENRVRENEEKQALEEARRERERVEAERRAREEEAARLAAEQERQRREEQMRREEEARLEAMRAAEIERQRVEAEQRARLEAMRREQEHAQQLEMIRQDQSKKKLRLLAFGAGALFLLAAGGGVATYVSLNQRAEAQKIANDAAVKQAEAQAEAARKDYQTALANIDNLKKQLESATDEATRQKLQRQLDEATKKATAVRGASGTGGPRPTGPSAPAGAGKGKCAPGDPLCVE